MRVPLASWARVSEFAAAVVCHDAVAFFDLERNLLVQSVDFAIVRRDFRPNCRHFLRLICSVRRNERYVNRDAGIVTSCSDKTRYNVFCGGDMRIIIEIEDAQMPRRKISKA